MWRFANVLVARPALRSPPLQLSTCNNLPVLWFPGARIRSLSQKVPEQGRFVYVPEDEIQFKAVRASGPGGQNVNKVSTAVELRFSVQDAWWLQEDEKQRLMDQQSGRINKAGELIVTSQVGRTQHGNRKDAFKKLQNIVNLAAVVPKEHVGKPVITEGGKRKRKEFKQQRKAVKQMRNVSKKDF